jgi:hypothetical protein
MHPFHKLMPNQIHHLQRPNGTRPPPKGMQTRVTAILTYPMARDHRAVAQPPMPARKPSNKLPLIDQGYDSCMLVVAQWFKCGIEGRCSALVASCSCSTLV